MIKIHLGSAPDGGLVRLTRAHEEDKNVYQGDCSDGDEEDRRPVLFCMAHLFWCMAHLFVIDLVDGKLNQAPVRTLSLIVCVCEMADNPNSIVFTRP